MWWIKIKEYIYCFKYFVVKSSVAACDLPRTAMVSLRCCRMRRASIYRIPRLTCCEKYNTFERHCQFKFSHLVIKVSEGFLRGCDMLLLYLLEVL